MTRAFGLAAEEVHQQVAVEELLNRRARVLYMEAASALAEAAGALGEVAQRGCVDAGYVRHIQRNAPVVLFAQMIQHRNKPVNIRFVYMPTYY